MTHFKLSGFRFNNLQCIAEKATQKLVLYLQPEIKTEFEMRSTFKILFYANKGKEKDGEQKTVNDPAEEEFRRRMQKKKKKWGPGL